MHPQKEFEKRETKKNNGYGGENRYKDISEIKYVAVLVEVNDGFALVYNKTKKCWELPGGKIEKGESPETAAKRECMEEGGIKIIELRKVFDSKNVRFFKAKGEIVREGEMMTKIFNKIPLNLCYDKREIEILLLF